jgi:type IV secretion system protein VirD4
VKAKTVVLLAATIIWLSAAGWAVRYVAGGIYLISHKASPMQVQSGTWSMYWSQYQDDRKEKKRLQASMGFSVFLLFGLPLILIIIANSKARSLHGEARWANTSEVKEAGLLEDDGLILGKLGGRFLMTAAPKFAMLVAPTRSGKGVGTIIPNLLNWRHSVVVVDIKGENFDVTSGFRAKHGHEVYRFAPFDDQFETHCSNPLSYISRDPRYVVGELQSVGYMLYPKKDGDGAFWNDAARNLFVAIALYCLESNLRLTMGEVYRRASGEGRPKEFWQSVVDSGVSVSGQPLSPNCTNALNQFVSNSDNTLTSILSTFNAPLGVFANPAVDAATSGDDFDLRDVRRRRMSIYVVIPPNRLAEASLLINLFFSTLIDQNTKTLPEKDPSLKYLTLLLLDEFPALGRVDKYIKSIGYFAGYGLRSLMIAQSLSQLKERDLYGDEGTRTLATNHMIQIMYAPRDQHDAQEYSEILGYYGLSGVSKGTSRARGTVTSSENVSEQKRALMLPQELREIGPDKIIVMTDGCKPIFADKIKYYTDSAFKTRLMPPVKVPAIDMDTFIAKSESRVRPTEPGEEPSAGRLALNVETMPAVTNKTNPVASEVTAMANWLFSNVQWVKDQDDSEPDFEAGPINTIHSPREVTQ